MKRLEVENATIYCCLMGSRLYGTDLPDSDYDYKGIFIGDMASYFGLPNQRIEQVDKASFWEPGTGRKDFAFLDETDTTFYEIRRFFELAMKGNPNVLEMLFAPDEFVRHSSSDFLKIKEVRDDFISQKALCSLLGYAKSQRYRINQHRKWLMGDVPIRPELKDYMPEGAPNLFEKQNLNAVYEFIWLQMRDKIELLDPEIRTILLEHSDVKNNMKDYGLSDLLLETVRDPEGKGAVRLLKGAQEYRAAMRVYKSYESWKKNRNPDRKKLEEICGYDAKHACHLIRLLLTAYHLTKTGKFMVRHDEQDLEALREIRTASWEWDTVNSLAENLENEITGEDWSRFPKRPPYNKLADVLIKITRSYNA